MSRPNQDTDKRVMQRIKKQVMTDCVVCNGTKRAQLRVMPFHPIGTVYHYDCPACVEATSEMVYAAGYAAGLSRAKETITNEIDKVECIDGD